MWGETSRRARFAGRAGFQSTRPVWGETTVSTVDIAHISNFNPLAPCGARPAPAHHKGEEEQFQSTRPVWGETFFVPSFFQVAHHFNPLAPCGARLSASVATLLSSRFQSTRPVWGETETQKRYHMIVIFQSTRPVWGETRLKIRSSHWKTYFNPLAPCGARHLMMSHIMRHTGISIHSPRVGRDSGVPLHL